VKLSAVCHRWLDKLPGAFNNASLFAIMSCLCRMPNCSLFVRRGVQKKVDEEEKRAKLSREAWAKIGERRILGRETKRFSEFVVKHWRKIWEWILRIGLLEVVKFKKAEIHHF
jgi:hypothetical protein